MEDKKNKVLLSIIIPVYKVEAYIDQCIRSILQQNSDELEIVLVDDGSPDKCPEICDKYAFQCNNITVIHKENGGLVSARKHGIQKAKGTYITFVDSDDWVADGYFSRIIEIAKRYSPDIIAVNNHYKVEIDGKTITSGESKKEGLYRRETLEKEVFPELLYKEPFYSFGVTPALCLKTMKKELLIESIRDVPDQISMGEDVCTSFPAILLAETVYFADICGYYYRMNPTSITHKYDKNAVERNAKLLDYMEKQLKQCSVNNIDVQMDMYAVWIAMLTITSLILGSNDIRCDLDRTSNLLRNKHIIGGLKRKIPLKTKIVVVLAKRKNAGLLLLMRQCFMVKMRIKKYFKN